MEQSRSRPATRTRLRAIASAAAIVLAPLSAAAVDVGERAPQFTANSLFGEGKLSLGDHRGKVVYVDFWASWCAPCLESLPELDALHTELRGRDFEILAINVDRDVEKAREFLERRPVSYESASDPQGRLPEAFGLKTMPTSFLIDRQGVVRHVQSGFRSGDIDEIRARIEHLIDAGGTPDPASPDAEERPR